MMNKASRPPQNRQMIKYAIRQLLTGRVFRCFLACLIPMALPWIMRLIPTNWGIVNVLVADLIIYSISLPMLLLSFVATTFVTDPITVRLAAFFLTFNRDPENLPSPLSVCDCFGPGYLRLVKGMLLRSAQIMLWTVVPLLVALLIPGSWQVTDISGLQVFVLSDGAYWAILLAACLNIYRSLVTAMVPYVLADRPEVAPLEALRISRAMTRHRIWELLLLELSFFGWLLLASVTFMIGGIYAYPYMEGTMAAYYIAFSQPMPWEERVQEIDDDAAG